MEVVETTIKVAGPVRVARVESASEPGTLHRVAVSCDCKGFRFAGHCRHVALAGVELRDSAHAARSRHAQ
jgi:hypothetical protein